jgi:hypothetical protein
VREGAGVGEVVGIFVGAGVGVSVGKFVGAGVGVFVGAAVAHGSCTHGQFNPLFLLLILSESHGPVTSRMGPAALYRSSLVVCRRNIPPSPSWKTYTSFWKIQDELNELVVVIKLFEFTGLISNVVPVSRLNITMRRLALTTNPYSCSPSPASYSPLAKVTSSPTISVVSVRVDPVKAGALL